LTRFSSISGWVSFRRRFWNQCDTFWAVTDIEVRDLPLWSNNIWLFLVGHFIPSNADEFTWLGDSRQLIGVSLALDKTGITSFFSVPTFQVDNVGWIPDESRSQSWTWVKWIKNQIFE
jgi:hypothetical protein